MTAALAIGLLILLGASLGLNGWLTYRSFAAVEKNADARVAQGDTENHLERAQFELETTTKALNATKRRADILEKQLAIALGQPFPDADLAPDDVSGRVLHFAQAWREADDARDSVPAEPYDAVSVEPAAKPAAAPSDVLINPFADEPVS